MHDANHMSLHFVSLYRRILRKKLYAVENRPGDEITFCLVLWVENDIDNSMEYDSIVRMYFRKMFLTRYTNSLDVVK